MTTLEFLQRIIPADGTHYLVSPVGEEGFMRHRAFDSLEALASALVSYDKELTVYHACASYLQPYVNGVDRKGTPKKLFRKPVNWSRAKAFWIDIDCGQEKFDKKKGYLTKRDAWAAVTVACQTLRLPLPMLVDSGYGLHCYWPLEESVSHEDWRHTANIFKAVLKHLNLVVDDSRTADFASILRPVGTTNKKDPANSRPVVLKLAAQDIPYEVFHEIIQSYADANAEVKPQAVRGEDAADLGIGPVPEYLKQMSAIATDELAAYAHAEYPHGAPELAEGCQQVRAMRVDNGKGYNHWFGVIGLLTFCEQGLEVAHEWSRDHELYDEYATEQKFDTWGGKPTTCEFLENENPGGCEGCAHRGKIKTPLVLARKIPAPKEETITVVRPDGKKIEQRLPEFPEGFTFNPENKLMEWKMRDLKGKMHTIPFTAIPFYPIARVVGEEGDMSVVVKAHFKDGQIKQVTMKTEIVGVGGRDLRRFLGAYGIVVESHVQAPAAMDAFVRASINKLMEEAREVETHVTFGWDKDKKHFLHGKKMYTADGQITDVRLAGQAAVKEDVFYYNVEDFAPWTQSVNFIYNRPGMEMYQYTIASAFGSALTPFGETTYHGIPVALTSTRSALGKTTASKVALSVWGDADSLKITGEQGATTLARFTLLGAMNNIPMLMDELTTAKPEFVGDMLYAMSNGLDRIRVRNVNGEQVLSKANHWNSANFITGNTRIASALASIKVNSQAESVRVFEIYVNKYETGIPMLPVEDMAKHIETIMGNPGAAGAAFIHYVVQHREEVQKMMATVHEKISNSARAVRDSQYRFYRQHATCTLTAAIIAKKLGLVDFDLQVLHKWTCDHIEQLCIDVTEMNTMSPEETFNHMVNDLSNRIISSDVYRDARTTVPQDVRMNYAPVGRWILGSPANTEPLAGRLYLTKKDMREWCGKNRADIDELLGWSKTEGIFIPVEGKFNITRGTTMAPTQHFVYCFDVSKTEVVAPGALRSVGNPGDEAAA